MFLCVLYLMIQIYFLTKYLQQILVLQCVQKFEGLLAGDYLYPLLLCPIFDWLILLTPITDFPAAVPGLAAVLVKKVRSFLILSMFY